MEVRRSGSRTGFISVVLAVIVIGASSAVVLIDSAWADAALLVAAAVAGVGLWRRHGRGARSDPSVSSGRTPADGPQSVDDLTGLWNRRAATAEIDGLRDAGVPEVHCIFIDLDDFKALNDQFGYDTGDASLQAAAAAIRGALDDDWHLSRFGGDEFVAVGTRPLAVRERETLMAIDLPRYAGRRDPASWQRLSVGTTSAPGERAEAVQLFREASDALRQAKRRGKHQIVEMDEDLRRAMELRLRLIGSLQSALEQGQITPWAQRLIRLEDGATVGLELLARWERDGETPIMPPDFIPLVEEIGYEIELGDLMMGQAIDALTQFAASGCPDLVVSVNLSARHLYVQDLASIVTARLAERQIAPENLVLEITESEQLPQHADEWKATARELRAAGVAMAIDDFGSGYSSFDQLMSMPFTHLKIDRVLTAASVFHPAREIADAIASFTSKAGIRTVAEGVQTEAERQTVRELGYWAAQGNLLHVPEPLRGAVETIIAERTSSTVRR